MMTAYDYDKQEWVQGKAAAALLISQAERDLELINSPKGQHYLDYIGSGLMVSEASRIKEDEIKHLKGE